MANPTHLIVIALRPMCSCAALNRLFTLKLKTAFGLEAARPVSFDDMRTSWGCFAVVARTRFAAAIDRVAK